MLINMPCFLLVRKNVGKENNVMPIRSKNKYRTGILIVLIVNSVAGETLKKI